MPDLPKLLTDLHFDSDNANRHNEHGMAMLEEHIQSDGLGRSILADKHGNIIAGNGVLQAAMDAGLLRVIPVVTTGNELVVVIREDVELDSPRGRRMALADNAIGRKNLDMDEEVIRRQAEAHEINLDSIGLSDGDIAAMRKRSADSIEEPGSAGEGRGGGSGGDDQSKFILMVTCTNREDQVELGNRLREQGYNCRQLG